MVLKPPEGSSSPLTDCAVGRAQCGGRETMQAQKQDMKGLINRRKRAPKAPQTLAGTSVSQRRHPQQSQHKTRTCLPRSSANSATKSLQHFAEVTSSLIFLNHLQNGVSMYLLMKWVENYKALYIFSSWNYYYNYFKENYSWKEVWERGKKDFCEEKQWNTTETKVKRQRLKIYRTTQLALGNGPLFF